MASTLIKLYTNKKEERRKPVIMNNRDSDRGDWKTYEKIVVEGGSLKRSQCPCSTAVDKLRIHAISILIESAIRQTYRYEKFHSPC